MNWMRVIEKHNKSKFKTLTKHFKLNYALYKLENCFQNILFVLIIIHKLNHNLRLEPTTLVYMMAAYLHYKEKNSPIQTHFTSRHVHHCNTSKGFRVLNKTSTFSTDVMGIGCKNTYILCTKYWLNCPSSGDQ